MTFSKLAATLAEDFEIMTHADNYSRSLVAEKIQCAIDAAVAEERETSIGVLADEIMSWQDGNDDAKDVAAEALRIARDRIRARGVR